MVPQHAVSHGRKSSTLAVSLFLLSSDLLVLILYPCSLTNSTLMSIPASLLESSELTACPWEISTGDRAGNRRSGRREGGVVGGSQGDCGNVDICQGQGCDGVAATQGGGGEGGGLQVRNNPPLVSLTRRQRLPVSLPSTRRRACRMMYILSVNASRRVCSASPPSSTTYTIGSFSVNNHLYLLSLPQLKARYAPASPSPSARYRTAG
eukprot:753388-Hanusia_phi.AAC.7